VPDPTKEFIRAAKSGDVTRLETLLSTDKHLLDARDTDGSTPLHCATWKGHRDAVALLIAAGADIDAHNTNDHWGTTPLHAAAHANQAVIARMLIEAGADINARDRNNRTPMDHTTFHKATAAAKVLTQHGGK
jgi:ankyrin repeat protein